MIKVKELKQQIKRNGKGVKQMSNKKEFTEEEKALFVMNNSKIQFWVDKQLAIEFSKIAKLKGSTRNDVLAKFIEKYVDKNKSLLEGKK